MSVNIHSRFNVAVSQTVLHIVHFDASITLKHKLIETVTEGDILLVYYEKEISSIDAKTKKQLTAWQHDLLIPLILEAVQRSATANNLLNYAKSILEKRETEGVKNLKDVAISDRKFSMKNY